MSGVTVAHQGVPIHSSLDPLWSHQGRTIQPRSSTLAGLWRNTLHIIELKESDHKKGILLK